jgi:hypothetical protein
MERAVSGWRMKAITVQQPWGWAIILGQKNVENRTRIGTWLPARDSRIAIHAGRRISERGMDTVGRIIDGHLWDAADLHRGAIIGTVLVEDIHPDAGCCAPWGESSYLEAGGTRRIDIVHLVLAEPRPCDPIPCRGQLGLWTLPDDIAAVLA